MTDVFSASDRSRIMRAVRSKGNKTTELTLASFFRRYDYRGWTQKSSLPGSPDFIFPNHKLAIFVDGCFWHGHKCRKTKPSTNASYWREKIAKNMKRDRSVTRKLRLNRWRVMRFWECKLNDGNLARRFHQADIRPHRQGPREDGQNGKIRVHREALKQYLQLIRRNREIEKTFRTLQEEQEQNGVRILALVLRCPEIAKIHRSR